MQTYGLRHLVKALGITLLIAASASLLVALWFILFGHLAR